MTSGDSVNPALHIQPAVMVGGQRRRVTRRSNVLRTNTVPSLSANSSSSAGNSTGVTTAGLSMEHGTSVTALPSSAPFNSMNPSWTPNSYTDKLRPSSISCSSDGSPSIGAAQSPTLTVASTCTSSKEGKKKHGMFGFKSKDQNRPNSSHGLPLQSSPLPPRTPVKAAQFLGVDIDPGRARSESLGRRVEKDGSHDLPVGKTLRKQISSPLLTTVKEIITGQSRFKEQGIESDVRKSKGFWGSSNKKAQRMLGLAPSFGSSYKTEAEEMGVVARHLRKDAKQYYSSEPEFHAASSSFPGNVHPVAEAPSRRSRKKVPKRVDRMTPITETSHDELRDSYNSNFELDIISEYEDNPQSTTPLDSVFTETLFSTSAKYELEESDISPTDAAIKDETEAEEHIIHPGSNVNTNSETCQHPQTLHLRGPLQTVEDCLLDATEAQLKATNAQLDAYKNLLDLKDYQRRITDAAVMKMKAEHEAFKKEFEKTTREWSLEQRKRPEKNGSDDNDDLPSIRRSIDLDEEPTVHIATVMPIMVVKPGMVKLVDIPPRKKKPIVPVDQITHVDTVVPNAKIVSASVKGPAKSVQPPLSKIKLPFEPAYHFQPEEIIGPFDERSRKENLAAMPSPPLPAKDLNLLGKEKRSKPTLEELQVPVQEMPAYNLTTQRYLSERIDTDELADQAIPPPPLPKDDHALSPVPPPKDHIRSPHPVRSSSKEHHCITNGHIFYPCYLNTVPDETGFNSLEVRPYLRTPIGVKQHVHIPVLCETCDKDVKGELWKCSMPNCSVGVCKKCAEDMEHEWIERVTKSSPH